MLTRVPHPYTTADATFFLDHVCTNSTELTWAVEDLEGTIVGNVGLGMAPEAALKRSAHEAEGKTKAAVVGFWYGQAYWGRGYATEVARALVHHAFTKLSLDRVVSGYFAANAGSARVHSKLGFRVVGKTLERSAEMDTNIRCYD